MNTYKGRQYAFLQGLAKMMLSRNAPLPPSITGVDVPFDPATSLWRQLEPGSEVGSIKLVGRDVDLFRLWLIVYQQGGAGKMAQSAWLNVLSVFGLPEQLPHPQENGNTSTAVTLAQIYMSLLGAFDEAYNKNMSDNQRTALANLGRPFYPDAAAGSYHGQGMAANVPAVAGGMAAIPTTLGAPTTAPATGGGGGGGSEGGSQSVSSAGSAGGDAESEARKRKLVEAEEADLKRSRRKTGKSKLSSPPSDLEVLNYHHYPFLCIPRSSPSCDIGNLRPSSPVQYKY